MLNGADPLAPEAGGEAVALACPIGRKEQLLLPTQLNKALSEAAGHEPTKR